MKRSDKQQVTSDKCPHKHHVLRTIVIYTRYQTEQEASDAHNSRYTYIYYELFLEDKHFKKSPELAIQYNSYSDRKQVSEEERELIASKIRAEIYKFYNIQEPDSVPINSWQLIINH